jgi:hypothetical protein
MSSYAGQEIGDCIPLGHKKRRYPRRFLFDRWSYVPFAAFDFEFTRCDSMCPAAEARKSRLKLSTYGTVDHIHSEMAEDNGREIRLHSAKILAMPSLRYRVIMR